jgi:hypothetical protein
MKTLRLCSRLLIAMAFAITPALFGDCITGPCSGPDSTNAEVGDRDKSGTTGSRNDACGVQGPVLSAFASHGSFGVAKRSFDTRRPQAELGDEVIRRRVAAIL